MSVTSARFAQHQQEKTCVAEEITSPKTPWLRHQTKHPLETQQLHPVWRFGLGAGDEVESRAHRGCGHTKGVADALSLEVLLRCTESNPDHVRTARPDVGILVSTLSVRERTERWRNHSDDLRAWESPVDGVLELREQLWAAAHEEVADTLHAPLIQASHEERRPSDLPERLPTSVKAIQRSNQRLPVGQVDPRVRQ